MAPKRKAALRENDLLLDGRRFLKLLQRAEDENNVSVAERKQIVVLVIKDLTKLRDSDAYSEQQKRKVFKILDKFGCNLAHFASWIGSEKMLRILMEIGGINLSEFCEMGSAAIHDAVMRGNLSCVRAMVETGGVDINLKSKRLKTPLQVRTDSSTVISTSNLYLYYTIRYSFIHSFIHFQFNINHRHHLSLLFSATYTTWISFIYSYLLDCERGGSF